MHEGGIFKRHWHEGEGRRYSFEDVRPSDFVQCFTSWDFSVKAKKTSDRVSGQLWGKIRADHFKHANRIALYDAIVTRADFVDSLRLIKAMRDKHPWCADLLIEDKANGSPIITTLRDHVGDGRVIPFEPGDRSKEVRAHAVAPSVEAGLVIIPYDHEADWVSEWLQEITSFPKGEFDDQVDVTTQALLHLTQDGQWVFSF
jgi:predicted phage terminase large subunit-like protein